jgi:ribosome recycling factor|tara:strand:- start:190 stop:441 length:252 start_codon:yes stop_codon:yes gene_type:complete
MIKLKLDSDCKIECSHEQNELKLTNMAEEHRVEVENITTRYKSEISALQKDKDETKAQTTLLNQQLNTLQAQAHSKEEQASEY